MSKVGRSNWPIIITAYTTLFCLGLLDNARGPFFANIMHDLNLTNFQGSLFYAVGSFLAYITGGKVAHWSKQFGTLVVVRSGQIIMAVGFAAIALAHSLSVLLLFCAVFGFGFGILNVGQNLLVLEGATGEWRRRFFSGLHGMYAVSSLIAPLICAAIFRAGHDWRFGFILFACLASLSIFVGMFAKNHKHEEVVKPVPLENLWTKYFWPLLLISFYSLAEISITTRVSLYLFKEHNFSSADAATWLGYFFVGMLIGRTTFFIKHFHWPTRTIIGVCLGTAAASFVLGLFVQPVFLVVCGLGMGPIFGLCVEFIADIYRENSREAIAFCIAKSGVFIVTMHLFMGLVSDLIGIKWAMAFGPIYLFIAIFALRKSVKFAASKDLASQAPPSNS